MMNIYDYAFGKGLIILQHAGYDPAFKPPFHSSPKAFANVVRAFPGCKMVLAHLGGQKMWDQVEEHLVGLDVYLDTSMGTFLYPTEQFVRIVKNHGSDKILFGSDAPWSVALKEIDFIRSLNELTEDEKSAILGSNAARLLGIERAI
jgi:predicted TIM-barrel fold metal-dependent hydrolase